MWHVKGIKACPGGSGGSICRVHGVARSMGQAARAHGCAAGQSARWMDAACSDTLHIAPPHPYPPPPCFLSAAMQGGGRRKRVRLSALTEAERRARDDDAMARDNAHEADLRRAAVRTEPLGTDRCAAPPCGPAGRPGDPPATTTLQQLCNNGWQAQQRTTAHEGCRPDHPSSAPTAYSA